MSLELVTSAKFCATCKYYRPAEKQCAHPNLSELDLVLGQQKGTSAYSERAVTGNCGLEGVYWIGKGTL